MSQPSEKVIKLRCDALLVAMLGKDAAPTWWWSRNESFDMLTAQEQWEKDPTVVYKYLMGHAGR
jgi:hypothetical protein